MTGDRPAPLTPFGCDMGGNDWYPLHIQRLRDSRFWRTASHLARSINVDLWGRAYQQVPAGSLPDDDIDLADWAGFGRDGAGWARVKAEVMAPWVLCSDGRWYHPTLSEVVLEAWERLGEVRRKQREKKAAQRERAKNARLSPNSRMTVPGDNIARPQGQAIVSPETPPSVPLQTPPCPPKTALHNTDSRIGTSYLVASAPPDAPSSDAHAPPIKATSAWKGDADFGDLWDVATPPMRRRAKSRDVAHKAWRRAVRRLDPKMIVAALRRYVREDDDVKRDMGQPGLQRWLDDRTYESWISDASPASMTAERWRAVIGYWREGTPWSEALGPAPDQAGCLAPSAVLVECGLGDRTVVPFQPLSQGSAA